ncbi:hypothetical protein HYS91_01400 [Candidatus Daviesbacteria bacterium]|nr:hypothetical protein [Candidatus Daviesbacteria bacterium]
MPIGLYYPAIMASPDLLARFEQDPGSLRPHEMYVVGRGIIDVLISPHGEMAPNRNEALAEAMSLAARGLAGVRTDPAYTEAQRFSIGVPAFFRSDWDSLPNTREKLELLAEAFYTSAAGLRTPLQERMGELHGEICDGFAKLAGSLLLGKDDKKLIPLEQVRKIYEGPDRVELAHRRVAAIAWAKQFISGDDSDQENYFTILEYFMDQGDGEVMSKLVEAHVRAVLMEAPSQQGGQVSAHGFI